MNQLEGYRRPQYRHRRSQYSYIVPCVERLNVDRFRSVENVAFVGWVQSLAIFVAESLKRVVSGVCGLRVDPHAKQKRK